nr:hypothetical protein [Pirellula staleyi]
MTTEYDYVDAYEMACAAIRPADPTVYIEPISKLTKRDRVAIVCRVSLDKQSHCLEEHEGQLAAEVDKAGATFVRVFSRVTSGCHSDWLRNVARKARAAGANVLLARDTSRFVRHPSFHLTKRPSLLPRAEDFERAKANADGLRLMTLFAPDAPIDEIRLRRTRKKAGRKPKRRNKPNHRQAYAIEKVTWARRLGMRSVREIAKFLERPPSTIQGWLKQYDEHFEQLCRQN